MSFDRSAVERALYDFARTAAPIPWIFANQVGDRPPRPYGTIRIMAADPIGAGDVQEMDSGLTITERLREVYHIEVSFQAYGQGAVDRIAALKTYAKRPSVAIGTPQTVRIGFLGAGEVRDLPQEISATWEGRAQCDFRFSARFNADLAISTIGTVEVSGAGTTQTIEEP